MDSATSSGLAGTGASTASAASAAAAATVAAVIERPILSDDQLTQISKEELILKWKQLQKYVDNCHSKYENNLKENQKKLNQLEQTKSFEIAKLKNIILMKYVSSKEQESTNQFQEFQQQSSKTNKQQPSNSQTNFYDPSINAIVVQLRKELEETRKKKDELQSELNSWKFNPESQMTKRLMAKCRKLLQENEELGKVVSSGNVAQLEHDLAYHKELLNEACENEQNLNSFLIEIDTEMEAMQATIMQQQLRIKTLEADLKNSQAKTSSA